jgi:hypothetical protein
MNHENLPESRRKFIRMGLTSGLLLPATALAAREATPAGQNSSSQTRVTGFINVREFGAIGDGIHLETKSLQAAINACAARGGGVVYFPPGRYLSGTIFLKSKITLTLEAGATLLGSTSLSDYPAVRPSSVRTYTDSYVRHSLLFGEGLDRVTITGRGTINGQGAPFRDPEPKRPYIIRLISCSNVEVSGIRLEDSPMWVQHYLECSHLLLRDLTIRSICNRNNDGIDIDACEKVRISNCDIISQDDAIVLKSTTERPCQDITITNCLLSSRCNALKLGTESVGGFRNIAISNCAIYDTDLSGLALETVDGGMLENVAVSSLVMRNVKSAMFLRLGNRARPIYEGAAARPIGPFRNVAITNVQAEGADRIGCAIAGIPGHPIENVVLENIRIQYEGGGSKGDVLREIPEKIEAYPEYVNFGLLPAYGFYCRHVRNLRLNRVHVSCRTLDERPALVCDDVQRLGISELEANETSPVVLLRNTRRALLSNNLSPEGNRAFLRVEGPGTNHIHLAGNDLSTTTIPVERGNEVEADAIVNDLPQKP